MIFLQYSIFYLENQLNDNLKSTSKGAQLLLDYNDAFKEISRKHSKDIDMASLNRDVNWKIESAKKHKELALSYSHKKSREKCPICNEIKHDRYVTIYDYDYLQCLKCGHIYLKDLIDENKIKELYLGKEKRRIPGYGACCL